MGDSSSWVDLIFSSQPNLVLESGFDSSSCKNCHHKIDFPKFNLKVL